MRTVLTKRKVFRIIAYSLTIILLILSSTLPFVRADGIELFLVHFFNPTSGEISQNIVSLYGIILPIVSLLSLIIDLINFKTHEYYKDVFNTCSKATLLAAYIFTLMNYFRVIYPNGFLVSGDVSFLYTGFYLFITFLIAYFINIVHKCDKLYHIRRDEFENSPITYDKTRRKYYAVVKIFSLITLFCFVSLLFVPFVRNYQNYMIEEGFTEILDKRTSIDYYIFAMFDKDFNLNILGLTLMFICIYTPTTLLLVPKKYTYIQTLIASVFNLILFTIAIVVSYENINLITPKIYLDIDPVSLVFITIDLLSQIVLIVFCSMLINHRRKEMKHVDKDVSKL